MAGRDQNKVTVTALPWIQVQTLFEAEHSTYSDESEVWRLWVPQEYMFHLTPIHLLSHIGCFALMEMLLERVFLSLSSSGYLSKTWASFTNKSCLQRTSPWLFKILSWTWKKSLSLYISDLLDDLLFHKSILIHICLLCLLLEHLIALGDAPVVRQGQRRVEGAASRWLQILPVFPK